jgi:predicted deacetylase
MVSSAAPSRVLEHPTAAPALLVSIHDVSPLTLEPCRRAVALAEAAGVQRDALTLLVIPRHEDRVSIHEHGATLDWLRGLARDGATLVTHGLTHRMSGRHHLDPWGAFWAHAFSRGQGELFRAAESEAEARIGRARELMARAGLEQALLGFVPPAWLLSRGARRAVLRSGFAWCEELGGIRRGGHRLARRVVGFGSLTPWEAWATARVAALQARLPPADTRLAIHPADLERPASTRAVARTLEWLLEGLHPQSYGRYLDGAS